MANSYYHLKYNELATHEYKLEAWSSTVCRCSRWRAHPWARTSHHRRKTGRCHWSTESLVVYPAHAQRSIRALRQTRVHGHSRRQVCLGRTKYYIFILS